MVPFFPFGGVVLCCVVVVAVFRFFLWRVVRFRLYSGLALWLVSFCSVLCLRCFVVFCSVFVSVFVLCVLFCVELFWFGVLLRFVRVFVLCRFVSFLVCFVLRCGLC